VAQIGQSSSNPVIAPGPVLLAHANDQVLDVFDDWWPARASTHTRSVEFGSDKPSVPPQNGVRQGGRGHLAKRLSAQSVADFAERHSLAIGECRASLQLALQDPIFGSQVLIA
jgi:hypothetical protein